MQSVLLLCIALGQASAFSVLPARRATAMAQSLSPGIRLQAEENDPQPPEDPPMPTTQGPSTPPSRDLFVPILVGVAFGGYALILLYDVATNGFCAPALGIACTTAVDSW